MSAPKQKTINLFVQEGFEHSTAGKLLEWLLSAGRTIVVLTELVVIIAFVSRFWLDKTLTDLSQQNTSKKVQIEAASAFEKDFKSVQNRLDIIKQLENDKIGTSQVVSAITQALPNDVILTSLLIANNKITIQAESLTENGIAAVISYLQNSKQFTNTTLSDIALENKGQQFIKFTVKSELLKGGQSGN